MAEFQEYVAVQKQVRAMKWDGENESYEALIAEIPNKFTYVRPTGTLTYVDATTRKTITVENGKWIVSDPENKTFRIQNDNDFNAAYELGSPVSTVDATAQPYG